MRTTLGQLIINAGLPKDLRNYSRVMDKDGVNEILSQVQKKYPDQYAKILHHLMNVGRNVSYVSGQSFSVDDLREPLARTKYLLPLKMKIERIQSNSLLSDEQKYDATIKEMAKVIKPFQDELWKDAVKQKNNFAIQVQSGARGSKGALAKLIGGTVAVSDYRGRPIPIPITNSYASGLDPAEFWAASYGVRSGYAGTKLLTADAGFLAKQLANASHRLVVTRDRPAETKYPIGTPANPRDTDNEGSVLAMPAGGYSAGTVLTPRILDDLKKKMKGKRILVHSPISSIADDDGIDAWSAGVRTKGRLPVVGDNVGIEASQALTERISQKAVGSKHGGGILGGEQKKVNLSGFHYFNRLTQAPKHFFEAGPVSGIDGIVDKVQKAPHGGNYVYVNNQPYYVPAQHDPTVKPGQRVEAGDPLSTGIPHPKELVRHKGIGEARRIISDMMYRAADESGWSPHRRNVDTLARALVNNIQITAPDGLADWLPDDIVQYSRMASTYKPRTGTKTLKAKQAKGHYLEQPVLHYSIGTRVSNSVLDTLNEFGVKEVDAHPEPPEFEPLFVRAMEQPGYDPDWQTQLGGFYVKRHFLRSAHRGGSSSEKSTSWMPSLAKGEEFGKELGTSGKY